MKKPILFVIAMVAIAIGALADSRTWTDVRGRTVKATLVGVSEDGKEAIFSKAGKSGLVAFHVDGLSSTDREWISAAKLQYYKKSDNMWVKMLGKHTHGKTDATMPIEYGKTWETIPVEETGIDPKVFDAIPGFIKSRNMGTTGLMIIVHGRVAFQYGDVKEVSYIASCRKSVLSMMYGNYVANGKIKLGG